MTLTDLTLVEWRNPWWLLLAMQPWFVTLWLRLRRSPVEQYAEAPLRPWVLRGAMPRAAMSWQRIAMVLVWALFAIAAAGPRLPLGAAESSASSTPYHSGNLMVALDVSPSMAANDVAPQRLQRAQLEVQDLLQRLRGERIGLIAFSANAGLLAPLTDDYAAFAHYLALADFSLFKTPGTQIAAALDLALRELPQAGDSARAVLLITDADADALSGEAGAAALAAAQRLKNAGVAFYILGVGTDGGAVAASSAVVRSDFTALQLLADAGAGTMQKVRDGDGDWRDLYDRGLLMLTGEARPAEATQRWLELYSGFLFAALILLLASTVAVRSNAMSTALLLTMFLAGWPGEPAWAAEADYAQAWRAYREGNFAQAQLLFGEMRGYDARMGAGAAAYRRKFFPAAIDQFTAALLEARSATQRADALFNLGNGFFQAGSFRAAADAYTDVLRMQPDDARAQSNLELATTRLKQARAADPSAVGVLGRRGPQTGGVLGEEIGDRPVMLEPSADEEKKGVAGAAGVGSEQARPRDQAVAGSDAPYRTDDPDRLYRAALKKRELAQDHPAELLREIVKRDTPGSPTPAPGLPPW